MGAFVSEEVAGMSQVFFSRQLVKRRRNNMRTSGSKGLKLIVCAIKYHCSSCCDCRKNSTPGYLQSRR